ncbi:exosortase-dependent surface protein XDP1 [Roseateles sp. BYS87W]|uniref:Exosortase-dependent surface protein XDP1 n=1 Tax=Pelomonas baiyunensis TaxID=3299026 RepID=A0ABW7GY09_9BURK
MTVKTFRATPWATLIAGLCLSGAASANWTFENQTITPIGTAGTTTITSKDAVASTATVQLAAFYATNANFGAASGASTWAAATLTNQNGSGQGVCSTNDNGAGGCGTPNHAIDNVVNTEGVLLQFSSSVILSSIGLGWTNSSSSVDVSLFRWTGAGNPTGLEGKTAKSMTGWELVGNYGDMAVDTTPIYNVVNTSQANGSGAGGSSNKGSSWWLISAYNSAFTSTASQTRDAGTLTNGDDYFKLFGVTGTTCSSVKGADCGGKRLPEPASLALVGGALLGMFGLRRRKSSAV